MRGRVGALCVGLLVAALASAPAQAAKDKRSAARATELPRCAAPLGRAVIQEPPTRWWTELGLSDPEALLKLFALRSGCLRVIDGNIAAAGPRGQRPPVDYYVIPDIANADSKTGGNKLGAAAGLLGERMDGIGGIAGGMRTKKAQAQALITLVDARSAEQIYLAEGVAQKTDISYAGGAGGPAWAGVAAAAGGAYADTDIGKVVSAAYFNAFVDLVNYLQSRPALAVPAVAAVAEQPEAKPESRAYRVTKLLVMRERAAPGAADVRSFTPNELVYPTGKTDGVWWEVDDENGNRGWVSSAFITPRS